MIQREYQCRKSFFALHELLVGDDWLPQSLVLRLRVMDHLEWHSSLGLCINLQRVRHSHLKLSFMSIIHPQAVPVERIVNRGSLREPAPADRGGRLNCHGFSRHTGAGLCRSVQS